MAFDSYVRVAPDSTGKYIRNQGLYVPIDLNDGAGPTTVLTQHQVVMQADPLSGKVILSDTLPVLEELLAATQAMRDLLEMVASNSGGGLDPPRLWAQATVPPPVDAGQPVYALGDAYGRQVVMVNGQRDLIDKTGTTISASTSETTIIAAGTGFNDLFLLLVSNTSASTSTRIDFRDQTAGTILFSLQSVGGANPVGFVLPSPIPQTRRAQNWTATCATSTTDIRILAGWVKNK